MRPIYQHLSETASTMKQFLIALTLACPFFALSQEDYSLHYEGKATTALVGDGKFIVKTAPEQFISVKVLDLQGKLRFFRGQDELLPASTLWNSTVFPGGVTYSIRLGKDTVSVIYGVLPGSGFTVAVEAPLTIKIKLELGQSVPLQEKNIRQGNRHFTSFSQQATAFTAASLNAFRAALEMPYRGKLVLHSPIPTLNKSIAFSQALLDLSYNGELMYCELFRWLDIWARDLGSGLLPGALVSGRAGMARQSLVYDLKRYTLMSPGDCKNSNDPSQGGTASEVGWTARSVWNYYIYSGNRDSLKKDAAILRPWVAHWIKRDYDEDGLITDVTDFMDHMIMMLSTNGVQTLASNAMYASLLKYAAMIEAELGNQKEAKQLQLLYQRTVNALNTKFWNEDKGYFSNMTLWGGLDHRSSQSSQAMLLKIGATDAVRTKRTLDFLRSNNWCDYGSITIVPRMNHVDLDNDQNVKVWPWWNLWEAEARFQHGDPAGGLLLLERAAATIEDEKYPGLIEETLDTTGISTGGNVFVTAAGNLLETVVKDLLGIEAAVPGWSKVKVLPAVPAAWTDYSCSVPTANGFILLQCSEGRLSITVTDPGIKTVLVKDPANTTVTGAAKQAWAAEAESKNSTAYQPVHKKKTIPLKKGKAALFHDPSFQSIASSLVMDQIGIDQLEKINSSSYSQLVISGNSLPLHTNGGKPVKEILDAFVKKGGTIIFYGATTNPKTDEDGAGILGEQSGIIDWYDYLPARQTTALTNWTFKANELNPEGSRQNGMYSTTVTLDAAWSGKDIYIELGPLVGFDSVFINGQPVANYRDMEDRIRQEYPTKTGYYDTHRYKMLSRLYVVKAGTTAYAALHFGASNRMEVRLTRDGLSRGIPNSNKASIGIMTDKKEWQPTDEALPGIGLATAKRKGVNYWGSEQFFNSWSTKHGLFGFTITGIGVQFADGSLLAGLPESDLPVETIYTDFALFKPWHFEALAYTSTKEALLYPSKNERYPCVARIVNTESGGGFILIATAIAEQPLGKEILKKLNIGTR